MTVQGGTKLSEDLGFLLSEASSGLPLTLGEIEERLKGRGFALFIMLLSAPFLVPNIPGLSTPFGFAICLMGARLAVGGDPWLPDFILKRPLTPHTMEKILRVLLKVARFLEKVIKPRAAFFRKGPGMINLIGLGIVSGGFFLLLPLPFPFTNTLPAISILLLTAGMMEHDGVAVLAGYTVNVVAWLYLGAWFILGKAGFDAGIDWLRGFFG